MNNIIGELDNLFLKIKENRNTIDISENINLNDLKKICNESSQLVAVYELEDYSFSMIDCSAASREYLGISDIKEVNNMGFKYLLKIIHPENINSVYRFIKFYKSPYNFHETYSHTFYINSSRGWEWTYASLKPAIFRQDGSVKYLLAVGCSINDLLKTRNKFKLLKNELQFFEENIEKYLSMTTREKEILKLITEEFSSIEIGEKLSISPYTVDTHRKNLIEKLHVKSSIGLAKYALIFNLI